ATYWDRICERFVYDAELAGLYVRISWSETQGIEVNLDGFDDKMPSLLQSVLEQLRLIADSTSVQAAAAQSLQSVLQYLANADAREPHAQARSLRAAALLRPSARTQQRMQAAQYLADLERHGRLDAMLQMRARDLCTRLRAKMLVVGNTSKEVAVRIADSVVQVLQPTSRVEHSLNLSRRVVDYAVDTQLRLPVPKSDEPNSCVIASFPVAHMCDYTEWAKWYLISTIASEHAFDQLRTKETLGYTVGAGLVRLHNRYFFQVYVQSNSKDAVYLDDRVEAWLLLFAQSLRLMSADDFAAHHLGAVTSALARHTKLSDEASTYWINIQRETYTFDRSRRMAHVLWHTVTQQQVADAVRALVSDRADDDSTNNNKENNNRGRRRFAVLLQSQVPAEQRALLAADDADAADSMLPSCPQEAEEDKRHAEYHEDRLHAHDNAAAPPTLPPVPPRAVSPRLLTSAPQLDAWQAAQPLAPAAPTH
ncbi:MAG: hypothetical protein MHM6MM_007058, partial [Cercozoa sp. M6MM]